MKGYIKMKQIKKIIYLLPVFITLSSPLQVFANSSDIAEIQEEGIMPCSDEIVTRYRNNNGVLEYRRWNVTKSQWVDSKWIAVPR